MRKFAYPYYAWLLLFVVVPLIVIVLYAFTPGQGMEIGNITFSLDHIKKFFEPIYLDVMWRSISISFASTLYCLILGYPVAYYIAKQSPKTRNILILLFMIPMWMNFLLRTYAWLTLLSTHGPINKLMIFLGLGQVNLLYQNFTIVLGMIYNFLPFMVLPIYSVLVKIDNNLLEAARDLGANDRIVFTKVVFPLSLPGIATGIIMVFIPALSTFVISNLLGGNKYNLIGNLIEQQFRFTGDWHFGSAMSLVLILFIILGLILLKKFNKDGRQVGGELW
ncbi:MAG: ABC transporter permease [Tissierellia bacterium]|nr:ABC transporter permease [Tissierellia bacterium]